MEQNIINVSYIIHRNERRIRLQFEPDSQLNKIVRHIAGCRWSRTLKSWLIPRSKALYNDFKRLVPAGWLLRESDGNTGLHEVPAIKYVPENIKRVPLERVVHTAAVKLPGARISAANESALVAFTERLKLKAYSESTIRTYQNEFRPFLALLRTREVSSLTAEEVKRYVLHCINVQVLSENTVHSRLNALKFYFEQVLGREKIFVEIPRPKKPLILPKVLGEQEISRLFKALDNKKHKAILFTAYSAGLRVSEAVSLRLRDIDPDRMQILVENAKGKKDRYVMLSPVLLDILRNYIKCAKPRPKEFLFEGQLPGEPLSTRLAQHIFVQARNRAGIKKQVTFHSLRHSFATHLLENGVDIKYHYCPTKI